MKDMSEKLQDEHKLSMKSVFLFQNQWHLHLLICTFDRLRTIQKYKKELGVLTPRRSGLSAAQAAEAVDLIELDDPLGRFGGRLVQEKLRNKGVHIARHVNAMFYAHSMYQQFIILQR